jgi:sarcosine oxidase
MPEQLDFVVVGGGLLGLAAASALSRRGRRVTVLEQAVPGHPGSGSMGSCRIFRLGYTDPRYVTAARRARELWHQLERGASQQILFPTPQLTFGARLPAVRDAMLAAGAPCELLPAAEATARFPGIDAGGPALLEPESCVTAADTALAALAATVPEIRSGVRVSGLADDGRRVTLFTDHGQLSAGVAVICAGPWTSGLLGAGARAGGAEAGGARGEGAGTEGNGAGLRVPSVPTLEQVAYLAPASLPPAAMPIFICHDDQSPYGLPVPGTGLYKTGIHQGGPAVNPDAQSRDDDPVLADRIDRAVRRYLPGLDPQPVRVERCIYDNTPDEDFILDRVGNVVIGCGTSGHGFKFGPLLGEWLAGLATEEPPEGAGLPDGMFGLGRFSRRGAGILSP